MAILRATLRHLLHRKWKLPLAVFLCIVGMVALNSAYDVAGIIQEGDAAAKTIWENPESRSTEQIEAMRRGQRAQRLVMGFDGFFMLGLVLVGFLMPDGVVANERRSGAIMLWAQHPMPLTRFYMYRYLGMQLANLFAQALVGVAVTLAVLMPNSVMETDLFAQLCVHGILGCAISFAVSALGIRRAAFLVLAYYVASNWMHAEALRAEMAGAPGTLALVLDVLPFLIFPAPAIQTFVDAFKSVVPWDWGATGIVLYHFALWTTIAWLGLRRIERKPLRL